MNSKDEVLFRQVPGAPHTPTVQRAVLQGFEFEYRIGHKHTKAEKYGREIGQKFVFILCAGRRGWCRREQIMGKLMGQGRDQTCRVGELARRVGDFDRVVRDRKRPQRMFSVNRS
jgi:uncharacterized protein YcaQ